MSNPESEWSPRRPADFNGLVPESWQDRYTDVELVESIDKPAYLLGIKKEGGKQKLGWGPLETSIKSAYKGYTEHPIDISEPQKPVEGTWNSRLGSLAITAIGLKYHFNAKDYLAVKGSMAGIPREEIIWSSADRKTETQPLTEREKQLQDQLNVVTRERNALKEENELLKTNLESFSRTIGELDARLEKVERETTAATPNGGSEILPPPKATTSQTEEQRADETRRVETAPPAQTASAPPVRDATQEPTKGTVAETQTTLADGEVTKTEVTSTNEDQQIRYRPSLIDRLRARIRGRRLPEYAYVDERGRYVIEDDEKIYVDERNGMLGVLAIGATALALLGFNIYQSHEIEEIEHRQSQPNPALIVKDHQITLLDGRVKALQNMVKKAQNQISHVGNQVAARTGKGSHLSNQLDHVNKHVHVLMHHGNDIEKAVDPSHRMWPDHFQSGSNDNSHK
jgi:peptidoglycan hydrolase CwlO-like protein